MIYQHIIVHGLIFKTEIGFRLSVPDVSLFNRQPVTQRQEMALGAYALLCNFIAVQYILKKNLVKEWFWIQNFYHLYAAAPDCVCTILKFFSL